MVNLWDSRFSPHLPILFSVGRSLSHSVVPLFGTFHKPRTIQSVDIIWVVQTSTIQADAAIHGWNASIENEIYGFQWKLKMCNYKRNNNRIRQFIFVFDIQFNRNRWEANAMPLVTWCFRIKRARVFNKCGKHLARKFQRYRMNGRSRVMYHNWWFQCFFLHHQQNVPIKDE